MNAPTARPGRAPHDPRARLRPPAATSRIPPFARRGPWQAARAARAACVLAAAVLALVPAPTLAATDKLPLTGGVSSIDGAAGGGLTPWAVIGSNATAGEIGATASATAVFTGTYGLRIAGLALGIADRVELSAAQQDLDTGSTGRALGLPGLHLRQDIVGAKLRLLGEAVLDSDKLLPQVAVGVELKSLDAQGLAPTLRALGAKTRGLDLTLSATKLLLAQGVLVNATLRLTQANQNGLLGFGGAAHQSLRLQPEFSLAWLASRRLALGAEYRAKPDNLNPSALGAGLREDDWIDAFVAWAPSHQLSLTLAWVDLGRIVPAVATRRQTGGYASVQLAY